MGKYINKGNIDFAEARRERYVDKSALIDFVNGTLCTTARMTCVSRARRFGKSLALQMLYAYYDCSCDSRPLFDDLAIAARPSYRQHLNRYYTIHLDITSFITGASHPDRIIDEMVERITDDIRTEFPDVQYPKWNTLMDTLLAVALQKERKFVMLIDEWDALCREASDNPALLKQYINHLQTDNNASQDRQQPCNKPTTNQQQTVLRALSESEKSILELMASCGYKDRDSFRKSVLNPLLESNLVGMTHPENPNHRGQRYRLTESEKQEARKTGESPKRAEFTLSMSKGARPRRP